MNRVGRFLRITSPGWTVLALLGLLVAAGCGDDDEEVGFEPPGTPTFVNGDGQVTLSWSGSISEELDDFAGYDVFRDVTTMVGLDLAELATRKINATPVTPSTRSYVDATPVNGTKYYYAVRTVKTNGDWSAPTTEIDTSPVEKGGLIMLAEFADPSRDSGFDLSAGVAVSVSSSDPDNRMLVDLYLGTAGSNDESTQQLAIKSPHLISGGGDWSQRGATFKLLNDADESTTEVAGWQDMVLLGTTSGQITSKVIAVRTPLDTEGEVHYGKITVLTTSGPQGQRSIEILYTFQLIPNYIRF